MMPKNHSNEVRDHFAEQWEHYDSKIRKAIPYYKECFDTVISIVQESGTGLQRILEIGVGTGNLTERLLQSFPTASLYGIDLVEDFLRQAKHKLSAFNHRLTLEVQDINDFKFNENYDLVVTSYVFHHVENSTQNAIYEEIFKHLNAGGIFINADFVDSSSYYFSRVFDQLRMQYMRSQGVDEDSIKVDYLDHRKLEIPMPLEAQLQFLRQVGYKDVECFWKYLNLAVFGGVKIVK